MTTQTQRRSHSRSCAHASRLKFRPQRCAFKILASRSSEARSLPTISIHFRACVSVMPASRARDRARKSSCSSLCPRSRRFWSKMYGDLGSTERADCSCSSCETLCTVSPASYTAARNTRRAFSTSSAVDNGPVQACSASRYFEPQAISPSSRWQPRMGWTLCADRRFATRASPDV